MEFTVEVNSKNYKVSALQKNYFLVSGTNEEYIFYKGSTWVCADDISQEFVKEMGRRINEKLLVNKVA